MKPMKAYLNILKYRVNIALKKKALNNYPITAHIPPTLFCNLRCPACVTGLRLGLQPSCAITWELYKSIIDEIGDYLFEIYLYTWGEPLLHEQTPEFIQYAKSKEIKAIVSTNLSINLSDEYIQKLVRSGLDQLVVSLDGATEETYNKYRRGGNFRLVRENMLRIQSAKITLGVYRPTIIWQFLVFRHNEHEVETVKSNYKNWGADNLIVRGAWVPSKPFDEGLEPSTIPQYNLYLREKPALLKSERRIATNRPCSWLFGGFVLSPNGKVFPCCGCQDEKDSFAEYSPSRGFFEMWNSESFKRARSLYQQSQKPLNSDTPSDAQSHTFTERLDYMVGKLEAPLNDKHLICEQCPMPVLFPGFALDWVELCITNIAFTGASSFLIRRKSRYFIAFLLMLLVGGMPAWKSLAWIIRVSLLKISSTFRSINLRLF